MEPEIVVRDTPTTSLGQLAVAAMGDVVDPELGLDIVSLGLVYRVEVCGQLVRVTMTMTSAACPLGEVIVDEVRAALLQIVGVDDVDVELVWTPTWTTARMSPEARAQLGWPS